MSGLLRRIKRSRPAEAGEPHPEGRAAEAEGAAPTAETPSATSEDARAEASEAPTRIVPPGGATTGAESEGDAAQAAPSSAGDDAGQANQGESTPAGDTPDAGSTSEPGGATMPRRRRLPLFRRRARELPPAASAPTPVLVADPNVPAGVDPAAAPLRPPSGRRGRLRRRLRYLRRARELMLRDLGGLLYEIHRTGGGNVDAHRSVVGTKVQRIAGVDAEAHALETALAAPRAEAVVFEPGIGGTCANCGELYGSDARFCTRCGTPIGGVAEPKPQATHEVVAEPDRRAFWRRAARPAAASEGASATKPADGAAPDAVAKPATDQPTSAIDAVKPAGGDQPAGGAPGERAAQAGGDEPAAPGDGGGRDEAATAPGERAVQAGGDEREGAAPDPGADQPDSEARAEREGGTAPDERAAQTGGVEREGDTAHKSAGQTGGDAHAEREGATADERAGQPGGEPPRDPFASGRNGRPEDHGATASTDPLFSRERS